MYDKYILNLSRVVPDRYTINFIVPVKTRRRIKCPGVKHPFLHSVNPILEKTMLKGRNECKGKEGEARIAGKCRWCEAGRKDWVYPNEIATAGGAKDWKGTWSIE